jgi:hypothetical protein
MHNEIFENSLYRQTGPLAKIISIRGTHVGSTRFVVYLKGIYIGTLLPKKLVSYSKKMGNFVFNYNKNSLHHWKTYKKPHIRLLNIFLILQIVFELLLF